MKESLLIASFTLIFRLLSSLAQANQLCLSCTDMVLPRDCAELTRCGPHEKCFVETYVNSIGSIRYKLGCRDVLQCDGLSIPEVGVGKRSGTNVLVCIECCTGDICNNAGCGANGYVARNNRGPLCANCQSQQFDDDCNKIQQCGRDEVCSLQKLLQPLTHEIRYTTQCKEHRTCQGDIHKIKDILKLDGTKRDTVQVSDGNGCIIRCCDGDLCNMNCLDTTTSTSVQTTTSTSVPTSTTSAQTTPGTSTQTTPGTSTQTTAILSTSATVSTPLRTSTTFIKIPTHKLTTAKQSFTFKAQTTKVSTTTLSTTTTTDSTTQTLDYCLLNPCMAGTCSNVNNSFQCTCYPGFTGAQCSQAVNLTSTTQTPTLTVTKATVQAITTSNSPDPCYSNPCMAGSCSIYLTTFKCTCFTGYWGRQCEKKWTTENNDLCAVQPCINGVCKPDNGTDFFCECMTGYTGKTCNESQRSTTPAYVDTCAGHPCDKGNCTRIDNYTFKCTCPLGYTGKTCNMKKQCVDLHRGDRVTRGPDWKWGDQDQSNIGTVIGVPKPGWIMVSWDRKTSNFYRNGAQNACDVWLYNAPNSSSLVSTNSNCEAHRKLCQAHCSPHSYLINPEVCDFCICNHGDQRA